MSLSATLGPHLPYLRRFARILTGSQATGDAYASAALEAVIADRSVLAEDMEPRAALFRVFLRIWQPVSARHDTPEEDQPADRNLAAMTPLPRAAFLLHAVEGFPIETIAAVLDRSEEEVGQLIDTAGREIASQISTDVLIIEDEPIIAMDLEALVGELGHTVAGVSRTHKEAVAAVAAHRPGLVLADSHLADGSSGLDAVNEILTGYEVPVVFITAYPERLLTGERPEPTFLITKPFRTETVKAIISQALFFDRRAHRPRAPAVA
jgi:DNA-directed RNA polymerase specialized sigma24 family protein/CheY-like chemotaxis protein